MLELKAGDPSASFDPINSSSRTRYIPSLEYVRAAAIAPVLLLHFSLSPPIVIEVLGHQGVRLFFVLSGFLITGVLLRQRARMAAGGVTLGRAIKTFYIRRAFRILPPFWLTLVVLFLLGAPNARAFLLWHLAMCSNFLVAYLERWPNPLAIFGPSRLRSSSILAGP